MWGIGDPEDLRDQLDQKGLRHSEELRALRDKLDRALSTLGDIFEFGDGKICREYDWESGDPSGLFPVARRDAIAARDLCVKMHEATRILDPGRVARQELHTVVNKRSQ